MLEIAAAIEARDMDRKRRCDRLRCGGQLGHDAMKLIAERWLPSANRDRRAEPSSRGNPPVSTATKEVNAALSMVIQKLVETIRPAGQRQPEPRLA